jgi:hypothetical protein
LNQIASTTPSTAASRSASSNTMNGDLPPSSSESFLPVPAVARRIARPTSVEPVNAILSTSACSAIRAPVAPSPVTMLTTPAGRPTCWQISANAQRGERRELRGLQHDGVSGGERRSDLPGEHQQREIPWDDLAAHADGLVVRKFVAKEFRPAGMVIEMTGDERDVDIARLADRLAVVEASRALRETARASERGWRSHTAGAPARDPAWPTSLWKRGARLRLRRRRRLRCPGQRWASSDSVGRIHHVEMCAIRRRDEGAIDEVTEAPPVLVEPVHRDIGAFRCGAVFHGGENVFDTCL